MKAFANGPSKWARRWKRYSINGYYFRAFKEGVDVSKVTKNNGVCVCSTDGHDYYGTLNEIVELSYNSHETIYKSIFFKCDWLDNSPRGLNVDEVYKLVDVKRTTKLRGHNPFVLAHQVDQVVYAPYPSISRGQNQWSAVFKIKPRSQIETPVDETIYQEDVLITGNSTSAILDGEEEDSNESGYVVVLDGEEEEIEEEGIRDDNNEEVEEELIEDVDVEDHIFSDDDDLDENEDTDDSDFAID